MVLICISLITGEVNTFPYVFWSFRLLLLKYMFKKMHVKKIHV